MIPQRQDQRVEPKEQDNMLTECTFLLQDFLSCCLVSMATNWKRKLLM